MKQYGGIDASLTQHTHRKKHKRNVNAQLSVAPTGSGLFRTHTCTFIHKHQQLCADGFFNFHWHRYWTISMCKGLLYIRSRLAVNLIVWASGAHFVLTICRFSVIREKKRKKLISIFIFGPMFCIQKFIIIIFKLDLCASIHPFTHTVENSIFTKMHMHFYILFCNLFNLLIRKKRWNEIDIRHPFFVFVEISFTKSNFFFVFLLFVFF